MRKGSYECGSDNSDDLEEEMTAHRHAHNAAQAASRAAATLPSLDSFAKTLSPEGRGRRGGALRSVATPSYFRIPRGIIMRYRMVAALAGAAVLAAIGAGAVAGATPTAGSVGPSAATTTWQGQYYAAAGNA